MKKVCLMIVGLAVMGAVVAYAEEKAGGASCPMSKSKAAVACEGVVAKMDLTAEQKAKVNEILGACKQAGCTKESKEKCLKDLEGVLSAEQMKEVKAACEKSGGCSDKPAEEKK
jgi:Spy/CpxP family protein refolding chaperone